MASSSTSPWTPLGGLDPTRSYGRVVVGPAGALARRSERPTSAVLRAPDSAGDGVGMHDRLYGVLPLVLVARNETSPVAPGLLTVVVQPPGVAFAVILCLRGEPYGAERQTCLPGGVSRGEPPVERDLVGQGDSEDGR